MFFSRLSKVPHNLRALVVVGASFERQSSSPFLLIVQSQRSNSNTWRLCFFLGGQVVLIFPPRLVFEVQPLGTRSPFCLASEPIVHTMLQEKAGLNV